MFETNRNSGYGVARRRQDYFEKPPYLNRNEFGVSAGGPRLPSQDLRWPQPDLLFCLMGSLKATAWTTNRFNVPTAEMRNGDFRGLVDSQGRHADAVRSLHHQSDDLARQPLGYRGVANTIDPARLSPTGQVPLRLHAFAEPAGQSAGGRQPGDADVDSSQRKLDQRSYRPPVLGHAISSTDGSHTGPTITGSAPLSCFR